MPSPRVLHTVSQRCAFRYGATGASVTRLDYYGTYVRIDRRRAARTYGRTAVVNAELPLPSNQRLCGHDAG